MLGLDVAGGAGIGTGRLARTLRARYRPHAASARLPEKAAVASNAMLAERLGSTISCIISRSPWAICGELRPSFDVASQQRHSYASCADATLRPEIEPDGLSTNSKV